MPPELQALLLHPATHMAAASLLAAVAGGIARAWAQAVGLDTVRLPGLERLRWSGVLGLLVFSWLGVVAAGLFVPVEGLYTLAMHGLGRVALIAGLVFGAAWTMGQLRDAIAETKDDDEKRRLAQQLRQAPTLLWAVCALTLLNVGGLGFLVLFGIGLYLWSRPDSRAEIQRVLGQLRSQAASLSRPVDVQPADGPVRLPERIPAEDASPKG